MTTTLNTILSSAMRWTDGTPRPCLCPLDCTCRNPYRNTICGCAQHYKDGTPIPR